MTTFSFQVAHCKLLCQTSNACTTLSVSLPMEQLVEWLTCRVSIPKCIHISTGSNRSESGRIRIGKIVDEVEKFSRKVLKIFINCARRRSGLFSFLVVQCST